MIYRNATIWEAEEITNLWIRMHDEIDKHPAIREEYNDPENLFIHMVTRIKHTNWIVMVAVADENIVGFIMGFLRWPDYNPCHMIGTCEALYVVPEYRHDGIHKGLMEASIADAKGKNVTQFEFIGSYDPGLIRFWDKLGFEPVQIVYRQKEDSHGREES